MAAGFLVQLAGKLNYPALNRTQRAGGIFAPVLSSEYREETTMRLLTTGILVMGLAITGSSAPVMASWSVNVTRCMPRRRASP